jgi:hypothetical protein
MRMLGGPILAAESWSATELLAAGWTEADLGFEQTTERAVELLAAGDIPCAKAEAGRALQLARENCETIDPRLGTSLANYGVCLLLAGEGEGVPLMLREALDVWRGSGPWIARMDAPRMARSSLFHMRMEALHRDTYRARWQERWREIAAEAKARLEALNAAQSAPEGIASEALARWRRERPAMLNDTRKLMAAAFLLLAPGAGGEGED